MTNKKITFIIAQLTQTKEDDMKMIALVLIIALALCSSVHAGGYVGLYGGIALYEKAEVHGDGSFEFNFKDFGYSAEIAFGSDLNDHFRIETAVGYQKCGIDTAEVPMGSAVQIDGDVSITALMANLAFDFLPHGSASPFAFAGIGIAHVEYSNIDIDGTDLFIKGNDDTVPAYNIGFGLSAPVGDKAAVGFKYRYLGMQDLDFDGTKVSVAAHDVMVGGRIMF